MHLLSLVQVAQEEAQIFQDHLSVMAVAAAAVVTVMDPFPARQVAVAQVAVAQEHHLLREQLQIIQLLLQQTVLRIPVVVAVDLEHQVRIP
jgi:hypothetical protein